MEFTFCHAGKLYIILMNFERENILMNVGIQIIPAPC